MNNEVVTLDFLDVEGDRIFFISLTKSQFNNLEEEKARNVFQNLIECGFCCHLEKNWKEIQQQIARVDIKFDKITNPNLLKNLSFYY